MEGSRNWRAAAASVLVLSPGVPEAGHSRINYAASSIVYGLFDVCRQNTSRVYQFCLSRDFSDRVKRECMVVH